MDKTIPEDLTNIYVVANPPTAKQVVATAAIQLGIGLAVPIVLNAAVSTLQRGGRAIADKIEARKIRKATITPEDPTSEQ